MRICAAIAAELWCVEGIAMCTDAASARSCRLGRISTRLDDGFRHRPLSPRLGRRVRCTARHSGWPATVGTRMVMLLGMRAVPVDVPGLASVFAVAVRNARR